MPSVNVDETVKVVTKTTSDLATIAWQAGLGAAIGIVVAFVAVAILRFMGRRRLLYREIVEFGRRPAFAVGAMTGAFLGTQVALTGLRHTKSDSTTMVVIERGVTIALIFAVTWLVVAFAKAVESTVVKGVQASENQGRANRVTTQSQIIRRVTQVVIIIAGLVSAIMTFPSVQLAMGSLLASAGLASVIAGMAARSMLGNVFAGLQLATTDAIRVDDVVVVVGDEQGTIEEITLTYVVMRTWDERRLILPSTHFTENPFANWTRGGSQSTGTFTLELDWRVPIAAMRAELARLVAASTAWDGRQASLEVSDAVSGYVTVRVVLTGADPGDVGALKSYVREELVAWLQREAPYALPRTRVEVEQVEVTQDLGPEEVARAAEEIVAKQKAEADTAIKTVAGDDDTATEAAGETAAHGLGARRAVTLGRAMGRSLLHRARRGGLGPR